MTDALILALCTGNICRSPYIQAMLRSGFASHGITGISVLSAGTSAVDGHPIAEPMARILAKARIESDNFHSQPLAVELVESADLILTATSSHRSMVAGLQPRVMPKLFTLRQFGRLIPLVADTLPASQPPADRLRRLTALCSASRGLARPTAGSDDDIIDPWRRSSFTYRRAAKAMDRPVGQIVEALARP